MGDLTLRKELLEACLTQVEAKLAVLRSEYQVYKDAVGNETKSTAGDKHDTSRSMMQLEQEKMGVQLQDVLHQKKTLETMLSKSDHDEKVGSIIYTDQGNFFISISVKPISIKGENFIPISAQSPIGKLLIATNPGGELAFNSRTYRIHKKL